MVVAFINVNSLCIQTAKVLARICLLSQSLEAKVVAYEMHTIISCTGLIFEYIINDHGSGPMITVNALKF